MNTPNKLFYATAHGWSSNGLYTDLGIARGVTTQKTISWRDSTARQPAQILVANDINWEVVDDIKAGTPYAKFPWIDNNKVKANRMRERAAYLLAEANRLDNL